MTRFRREVLRRSRRGDETEWLVATARRLPSGTVATMLTRRYHGLLMAAPAAAQPHATAGQQLRPKRSEYDGVYPTVGALSTVPPIVGRTAGVRGHGHHYIDRFHLEDNARLDLRARQRPLESASGCSRGNTAYVNTGWPAPPARSPVDQGAGQLS